MKEKWQWMCLMPTHRKTHGLAGSTQPKYPSLWLSGKCSLRLRQKRTVATHVTSILFPLGIGMFLGYMLPMWIKALTN